MKHGPMKRYFIKFCRTDNREIFSVVADSPSLESAFMHGSVKYMIAGHDQKEIRSVLVEEVEFING